MCAVKSHYVTFELDGLTAGVLSVGTSAQNDEEFAFINKFVKDGFRLKGEDSPPTENNENFFTKSNILAWVKGLRCWGHKK
jgi:hypothetical protein